MTLEVARFFQACRNCLGAGRATLEGAALGRACDQRAEPLHGSHGESTGLAKRYQDAGVVGRRRQLD